MLQLLLLINSVRQTSLIEDPKLDSIAYNRCITMTEFSHKEFYDHYANGMAKRGKYFYLGENLALNTGNATSTFKSLEGSRLHHANNIDSNYTNMGISTCKSKLGQLTVLLYAGKQK